MKAIKQHLNFCRSHNRRHSSVIFTPNSHIVISGQTFRKPSTPQGSVTNEILIGAMNNHGGKDCTLSERCTRVINDLCEWKSSSYRLIPSCHQLCSATWANVPSVETLFTLITIFTHKNTHSYTQARILTMDQVVANGGVVTDVVKEGAGLRIIEFTLSTHLLKCLYESTDDLYCILFLCMLAYC